jgi:hypothetical protein
MTERSDQKQLLDDVLAESSSPDFRAALLGEVLRHARRRRRWRQSRSAMGVLVVLFSTTWLVWHNRVERLSAVSSPRTIPVVASYQLVAPRPFPADAVVVTANFSSVSPVSSSATVPQIATSNTGFHYLDDAELLELAGPGAAILIRTGPHSEELVFAEGTNVSKPSPEN